MARERVNGIEDTLEPGWLPPGIAKDLGLGAHGLVVRTLEPWATVLPEDVGLELTDNVEHSADAIRKLSTRDAARWPEFCARMRALAQLLESIYVEPPPDPLATGLRDSVALLRTALRVRGLRRRGIEDLLRLAAMPVADWLDEWFENDTLKGVLGAAGIMHLAQGPRSGGTAFNLLHHSVGSPAGVFRPPLTNARAALARACAAAGVGGCDDALGSTGVSTARKPEPTPATRILVREGRVTGIALSNGE